MTESTMTAERWRQVKAIFQSALDLDRGQRVSFLDRACGDDAELRGEIESLLAHERRTVSFLRGLDDVREPGSLAGARLGPYRLLHELGRGGMSTVYLAARADRQFRRRVAVKLIRHGGVNEDTLRRFHQERQILASLSHPNIAGLLDGGESGEGWPYIVMEYVEGLPIDEYCDLHGLSVGERLKLVETVCRAVHYSHQNLVIHRDLKPANVLVTAAGVPRLLDFGIAKILNPELAGTSPDATGPMARLLTPEYASPEQLRGHAVTTASDVYSLGVLVYRLVTGRPPHDLRGCGPEEIARVVCEEPIAPPSARLADGARRRQVRGDLDNVVLKALAKEPRRRYASAAELGDDLARVVDGRPVAARPPTFGYRLGKLARRHRAAVAAGVLLALVLLAGLAAAGWQARRAVRQQAAAEKAEGLAEDLTALVLELLARSDPDAAGRGLLADRKAIDLIAGEVAVKLRDQPVVRARLRSALGEVYLHLGYPGRARQVIDTALRTQLRLLGEDHPDVVRSLRAMGKTLYGSGENAAAETYLRRALGAGRRSLGERDPTVAALLHDLALARHRSGALDEAEALYEESLARKRELLGDRHPDVALTLVELAELRTVRSDFDGARRLFAEALELNRELYGERHLRVARTLQGLADMHHVREDFAGSEELYRQALQMQEEVVGAHHPHTLTSLNGLARTLLARGELEAAEDRLQEVLEKRRQASGDAHPGVADALSDLARIERRRGEWEAAAGLFEEARRIYGRALGEDHSYVATMTYQLGKTAHAQGRFDLAESRFLEALEQARRTLAADDGLVVDVLLWLGHLQIARGGHDAAESTLREALELARRRPAEHYHRAAKAGNLVSDTLAARRRFAEAEEILVANYSRLTSDLGHEHAGSRATRERLVRLYDAWGKPERLEEFFSRSR